VQDWIRGFVRDENFFENRVDGMVISSNELKVYRSASHGVLYTHHHRLNADITQFLG